MEDNRQSEIHFPRIYTIHSQKGGVGKTSLAIAIAGFASIFHNKKTLIIDADLTGTSLIDVFESSEGQHKKYFNELILANPKEFEKYTPLTSEHSTKEAEDSMNLFCRVVPQSKDIFYMPSSPRFADILRVIPLISQEDQLHFFRHRLEDIITTAFIDKFEVIVIDHPPGLFGISTATLKMVFDQVITQINHSYSDNDKTRLNRLGQLFTNYPGFKGIAAQAFLVTTPDPADYRALLPSFSVLINNDNYLEKFKELNMEIAMVLNKAGGGEGKREPIFQYDEILKKVEAPNAFKDGREVSRVLISAIRAMAKKSGAPICGYIRDFDISRILPTIQSLKSKKERKSTGMEGWCLHVGKFTGLYQDSPQITKENRKVDE